MSERAAMKRRVRGLLRHNWYFPLLALILAWAPLLLLGAIAFVLLRPGAVEGAVQVGFAAMSLADPMSIVYQLLFMLNDPVALLQPLLGWLPLAGILFALVVFIGLPIMVGVSGYFLAFLRGKKPKLTEVYSSFSGRYPRALGGMFCGLLWQGIWLVVSFVAPTVVILFSVPVISALGIELSRQVYVFIAVLVVCLLWYLVFAFVFINRALAYCMTPVCIAAQPRLAAPRAARLSRRLMRGCKWRVLGLCLSYLVYFIPAIVAAVALPFISSYGEQLGLSTLLGVSTTTILWVIILANQAVWVYVAPYLTACFHALYIERKREALMDQEVTQDDFVSARKREKEDESAGAENE